MALQLPILNKNSASIIAPHRFLKSFHDKLPSNASRRLLRGAPSADIFHALNQRVDVKSRRTVSTFHDLFVMTGDYSSPDFRTRFTAQAREAAERSDLIIAVSNFTASQVEQLLRVERRASASSIMASELRRPATKKENLVLSVGAIQRRKNIARLVKAFEHFLPIGASRWPAHLMGTAQPKNCAQWKKAPRVPESMFSVMFPRPSSNRFTAAQEFLPFRLSTKDSGCRSSMRWRTECPVITSNCSAMPEVAGDAALLVDPSDIGDALLRLAGDESLRDRAVTPRPGRIKQFTWDRAVEKTWAVYDELR